MKYTLTKQQIDYPPQVPGLETLGVIVAAYHQWIWWRRANPLIPNTDFIIFPWQVWGRHFRGFEYIDTKFFSAEGLKRVRNHIR